MSTNPPLEITTTRIFNAPPEAVWRAWTDPAQITHWWGPIGFSTTIHKMDFRPGGEWNLTMHGPDGTDYENRKIFKEIFYPTRLVMLPSGPPATHHDRNLRTLRGRNVVNVASSLRRPGRIRYRHPKTRRRRRRQTNPQPLRRISGSRLSDAGQQTKACGLILFATENR